MIVIDATIDRSLVRRGDVLLDLSLLKRWGMELKNMNSENVVEVTVTA